VSAAKNDNYGFVRCQWDPDHTPVGGKHTARRAIQLGLKSVRSYIRGDDILCIEGVYVCVCVCVCVLYIGDVVVCVSVGKHTACNTTWTHACA